VVPQDPYQIVRIQIYLVPNGEATNEQRAIDLYPTTIGIQSLDILEGEQMLQEHATIGQERVSTDEGDRGESIGREFSRIGLA